ncbi:MAG TPA: sulfate ABC transporter permease subunit CysW [Chloroflexota bacterium]|nr:sulfate ABC transporter permease subunit CysW [Chloroflexota bacterium]
MFAGRGAIAEPVAVRLALSVVALLFLVLFLLAPVVLVFVQAFAKGVPAYAAAILLPDTLAAIRLTLTVVAIAVPANVLFGLAAAWAIAKFEFAGKSVLVTLIDLPLAISPVVSGMLFVLLFGAQGIVGPWLAERDVKIVFALPSIVMATIFVTFPLVARELIPVMEAAGRDEEEVALSLGARGWQTFRRVTLPAAKWALLYGLMLTMARAMGEFGAVSVVSGKIRGETNTIPLQVEILYNEYQFSAAFAVASLLTLLAVVTLTARKLLEWRTQDAH